VIIHEGTNSVVYIIYIGNNYKTIIIHKRLKTASREGKNSGITYFDFLSLELNVLLNKVDCLFFIRGAPGIQI
jgi:hypothetical protein